MAAAIHLNNNCRNNRSIIISVIITKAVIKEVAETLRANIRIYRPRSANSAGYFGIILFILYNLFKTVRNSGRYL